MYILVRKVEAEKIIEDLDEGKDVDLDERVKELEEIVNELEETQGQD